MAETSTVVNGSSALALVTAFDDIQNLEEQDPLLFLLFEQEKINDNKAKKMNGFTSLRIHRYVV